MASVQVPTSKQERQQHLWINLLKQGKFIVLGAALVWFFEACRRLKDLWLVVTSPSGRVGSSLVGLVLSVVGVLIRSEDDESGPWNKVLAVLSLLFLTCTIALFAVVMLLPLTGHRPNFFGWQSDAILRSLIPALTSSLVVGFIALVVSFTTIPLQAGRSIFTDGKSHLSAVKQGDSFIFGFMMRLTAAFGGATGVYLLVLGTVGLLGLFVVPVRKRPNDGKDQ